MDRFVGIIVRFMVWLAKFARLLPGVSYSKWQPGKKLKILLVGYNGARNTGADARVVAIVNQLNQLFGKDAISLSVMTLDRKSTDVYFANQVRQVSFSTLFFWSLFKECSSHHMALLCEGSTLKSTFANALTLYFCEAAGIMKVQGKPCVSYGSEAGAMEPFLQRIVADLCSDTFFIARTKQSLEIIQKLGLKGELGTDTAWRFQADFKRNEVLSFLRGAGWDGKKPLLAVAPINPFWWPVKPSLGKLVRAVITRDYSFHFKAWYFNSWSEERAQKYERYLDALANAVMSFSEVKKYQLVIVGMEALDEDACKRLQNRLGLSVPVVLSKDHDAFFISALLRELSALVTSRYHANLLAMESSVPAVAVSMDERLNNIFHDQDVAEYLLCDVSDACLEEKLKSSLRYVSKNYTELSRNSYRYAQSSKQVFDAMGDALVVTVEREFPGFLSKGSGCM